MKRNGFTMEQIIRRVREAAVNLYRGQVSLNWVGGWGLRNYLGFLAAIAFALLLPSREGPGSKNLTSLEEPPDTGLVVYGS